MSDWLKKVSAPGKRELKTFVIDVQIKVRAVDSDKAIEAVEGAITGDAFANLSYFNFDQTDPNSPHAVELVNARVVDSAANHMEAESSIFDNPEYQRQQENVGDSGDFDPGHILDNKPDFANDPGPASATPGAPGTSVAPGTGLSEGLFD